MLWYTVSYRRTCKYQLYLILAFVLTYCNIYHKKSLFGQNLDMNIIYTDLPINLIFGTDKWLNYLII